MTQAAAQTVCALSRWPAASDWSVVVEERSRAPFVGQTEQLPGIDDGLPEDNLPVEWFCVAPGCDLRYFSLSGRVGGCPASR